MPNKYFKIAITSLASLGLMMTLAAPAILLPMATVRAADLTAQDLTSTMGEVGEAAGIGTAGDQGEALPKMIGNIIKQILTLLGIIVVLFVIYAGFLWMTAQGDSKKVDEAKAIMKNAVIGLVIIFAAYSIASFVMNAVIKSTLETT